MGLARLSNGRANVVLNEAKAEWEGETAKAHYVSDLLATSTQSLRGGRARAQREILLADR